MYRNFKLIKLFNWLLVFLWAGLIFYLSNQPDLKSSLPVLWDFILRKLAHMAEYAILCFLIFKALRGHNLDVKKSLILAVIFSILYAISDEYHQTFIFGRQGRTVDVLIDSFGVIVFSILRIKNLR